MPCFLLHGLPSPPRKPRTAATRKKNPILQQSTGAAGWGFRLEIDGRTSSSYSGCLGGVFFVSLLSSFFLPSLSLSSLPLSSLAADAGFSSAGSTGLGCGATGLGVA